MVKGRNVLWEKFESVSAFIEQLHEYIYYYNHERISRKLKRMGPVGLGRTITFFIIDILFNGDLY